MTKPLLMGIVNATPDSFYDGDPQNNLTSLLAKCKDYAASGVDIFDIGGESTRPNAAPVSAEEEQARVLPLIRAARQKWPNIPVSLDTVKIPVALEGLKAGASIINDVSGTPDKEMFKLVRDFKAQIVVMHTRGTPQTMQTMTEYQNLLQEVKSFLADKIQEAVSCGVPKENVIIDVGFGFPFFKELGVRMLVGLSRKTFLAQKRELPPKRKAQTLAANLVALQGGADILRVHDVKDTRKIMDFYQELEAAQ